MNYNALFNSANYNDCLIRSAPGIGGNRSRRSSNRSFDDRQTKGMQLYISPPAKINRHSSTQEHLFVLLRCICAFVAFLKKSCSKTSHDHYKKSYISFIVYFYECYWNLLCFDEPLERRLLAPVFCWFHLVNFEHSMTIYVLYNNQIMSSRFLSRDSAPDATISRRNREQII